MASGEIKKLFGTDGIRAVAGEFPLDPITVARIGRSLTHQLIEELGHPPALIIGRDTRASGAEIEAALTEGAKSAGAQVQSAGVITTPGVAYLTRATPFDAGVVISASHNPYQDNGIKIFTPSGRKLADETERRIEAEIAGAEAEPQVVENPATKSAASTDAPVAHYRQQYVNYLVNEIGRGINLTGLGIGLDCANGAASAIAPVVFEKLGATVRVIFAEPDGQNINAGCGSLHTEGLRDLVITERLDLGVAFDGDADRALLIDETGALVDGDREMLILGDYLKQQGGLSGDVVIATVMSNLGLEIALRERGIELIRAQVGDRFVLEQLLARGAKVGGEQSGHVILPDIGLAGDGIVTALEVLRAVLASGRTLGGLASEMKTYPQVLVNVRVKSKPPLHRVPDVQTEVEKLELVLQGRGRLLVRYSGTENLARVMIEGEDQTIIEQQAHHLAKVIQQAIG